MQTPGPFLALVLLLMSTTASYTQEARLSYALLPGKIYLLDIDMQQNTSSESINSEEINMFNHVVLEFRLDSVGPEDHFHMRVRYNKLLLSMLAPGLGIDINSSNGDNQVLTNLSDSLQGKWFGLTMGESGELISLVGLEEIFQNLADTSMQNSQQFEVTLGTLKEAYGPDAFKSLFDLFIAFYPPVQPILNWTSDLIYYLNTKPVEIANRYYFTKTTGEVVTIQGMGLIKAAKELKETLPMGEVSSTVSGSQTYDIQTDASSGWLIRCISKQRLLIETTIIKSTQLPAGLKIPSYTETAFEVKGSVQ